MHNHAHHHGTCSHHRNCSHKHHRFTIKNKKKFFQIIGSLGFLGVFALFAPAILIAVLILAVNSVLELHKNITAGVPIDLEVLTVGVAYLAATGNPGLAALIAIIGPGLSEVCRGHVCTGTWFRPFALLAIIPVALAVDNTFAGLMIAVVVGVVANYIRVFVTAPNSDPFMSLLSRGTQILFAVHLLGIIF